MDSEIQNEEKKRIIVCVHNFGEPISVLQISRLTGLTDLSYVRNLIRLMCRERVLRRQKSANTKEWMICRYADIRSSAPTSNPAETDNQLDIGPGETKGDLDSITSNIDDDDRSEGPVCDNRSSSVSKLALTLFEKRDLIRRAAAGEQVAVETVFHYYLPKVRAIARSRSHGDDADIFQVGLLGLLYGIESFDPAKSTNPNQHLSCTINRAISDYIDKHRDYLKVPDRLKRASRKIFKSAKELYRSLNREPTTSELAIKTSLSEKKVRQVNEYKIANSILSLDEGGEAEGQQSREDILSDENEQAPELLLEKPGLPIELKDAFRRLREKEKLVLSLRYGLEGKPIKTLEEIGHLLSVSRQRVSQIQSRALSKLKTEQMRRFAKTLGISSYNHSKFDDVLSRGLLEPITLSSCLYPGTMRDFLYLLALSYARDNRGSCRTARLLTWLAEKIQTLKHLGTAEQSAHSIVDHLCAESYLRTAFNGTEVVMCEKGFTWLKELSTDFSSTSKETLYMAKSDNLDVKKRPKATL